MIISPADLCALALNLAFHYVFLQLTEAGVNGASGQPVVLTVRCGGAGSAPNPHLAPGAKTAKGWTSSLSTAPASSAHRVSAPPTCCKPNFQFTVQLFLSTAIRLYTVQLEFYICSL